ncbi:Hypothetical protein CINCED_3A010252 [Cinara cedri]|uniref:Uncharacterized protein n=1 Tax=Cinara cedri TaxID=506608 RepID=A0A5E4MQ93_9HEMI|nr:Hypothetical protein CINCED_3A010252 [Cinara cedri]
MSDISDPIPEYQTTQPGEVRGKRSSGKRTKAIDVISAEAELITKGLNNVEDVDGRRTTRSSTRGSTAASKLKSEPPAKKGKKSPAAKGGRRGRPKVATKEENEDAGSGEENGITENDADSKADKGGSSTEADSEVDSQSDEKVENGNSSTEEEKNVEEVTYYTYINC